MTRRRVYFGRTGEAVRAIIDIDGPMAGSVEHDIATLFEEKTQLRELEAVFEAARGLRDGTRWHSLNGLFAAVAEVERVRAAEERKP